MDSKLLLMVWLTFQTSAFLGWYFYNSSKHAERRLLIEKGINPEESPNSSNKSGFPWLRLGVVIMGLGLGFFLIALLVNLHLTGRSDALYPAILCLCGGGSLVIAHYIDHRKK